MFNLFIHDYQIVLLKNFGFSCQTMIFDFCELSICKWELPLMLIIFSQGEIHVEMS